MTKFLIEEAGRTHIHQVITVEPPQMTEAKESPAPKAAAAPAADTATSIKRGCIPCSIGHFTTCTGLLNEAMRFARNDGLSSDQVIEDTNTCLQELNALERVDLTAAKMEGLPKWEKDLAIEALQLSRSTRHELEDLKTVDQLERLTAGIQPAQLAIAKRWVKGKLASLPEADRQKVIAQAKGT